MRNLHIHAIQIMSLLHSKKLDVSKARSFDFNLYFRNEAAAQAAANRLVTKGFTARVSPAVEDRFPWWCAANRLVVPTYQGLSDLIGMLEALAAEYNGEYDGWGTFTLDPIAVGN